MLGNKMIIKNKNGYTLFEVMIAVLIVSLGMIALGGIMINSLRYSKESANRFVATQQLYEMADRMRANHKAVVAGNYDEAKGIPSASSCRTAGCSISNMAKFDINEWNTKNSRVLPKGEGTVTKNGDSFLITVSWQETEKGNATPVKKDLTMRIVP